MGTSVVVCRLRRKCLSIAAAFSVMLAARGWAEGLALESSGLRFGFAASDSSSDFHQAEAFVDWNLPWAWDLGATWKLQTRLDVAAGWLGEGDLSSAVISVGPILDLGREGFPVHLEGGVSPTGITRSLYATKDFGEPLQFTSHLGLYWDFATHFRAEYRFQHMSNAGFNHHNPGLNLHMLGVSYVF